MLILIRPSFSTSEGLMCANPKLNVRLWCVTPLYRFKNELAINIKHFVHLSKGPSGPWSQNLMGIQILYFRTLCEWQACLSHPRWRSYYFNSDRINSLCRISWCRNGSSTGSCYSYYSYLSTYTQLKVGFSQSQLLFFFLFLFSFWIFKLEYPFNDS